jgi:hypothetical protein
MIASLPINNNGLSPNKKELLLLATSLPELRTENDRKEALTRFRSLIEKKDESKSIFDRFGEILGLSEREDNSSILPKSEEIRIVNTSSKDYTKEGWYNWEIHLEAPQNVLGRIKSVKYVLHSTFNPPEYIIDDSEGGFRLSASGWGEFRVKVIITLKEKRIITKYHWLELAGETPLDK